MVQELLLHSCAGLQGFAILSLANLTQLTRVELHNFPLDSDLDIRADHDGTNVQATAEYMRDNLNLALGDRFQEMLLEQYLFDEALTEGHEEGDLVALTQERDRFLGFLASLQSFSAGVGEN